MIGDSRRSTPSFSPLVPASAPARDNWLSLVICGHVDHGKSTIVGRLLADTQSVDSDKLEQVRRMCERNARSFEYAFLLDSLKDERAQGITIEVARIFFRTKFRQYMIMDAPGHVEFLRNLVTGAAKADVAFLVIDAREGVQENSRRHAHMLALLGITKLVVLVNKMDLIDYHRSGFENISRDYRAFLSQLSMTPSGFIPVSGRDGENIARRSSLMPWYSGPTFLEAVEALPSPHGEAARPFRMAVQDIYKFTERGDDRRIIAGSVSSGRLVAGSEVAFFPSGKRAEIKAILKLEESENATASAGEAIGLTLKQPVYVTRGELIARVDEPPPRVTSRVRTTLFWLGRQPLEKHREYLLKIGTARVPVHIEEIHRVLDSATLKLKDEGQAIGVNQAAECTLKTSWPIACDQADYMPLTSRFVIVDGVDIGGGGTVRAVADDAAASMHSRPLSCGDS